jgi:ribosomal protein L12E/L44/L45/RPP1/RPP2
MNRFFTVLAMLLMYMLPALTTPVYAESHAKAADATKTEADTEKKKADEEEEEEEPDCD